MHYFGVPTCPYCKKRVNLIRTWSLKRQGEYQCPRCGGISNIFLSPLIYIFGLLAVFSGGAVYFFHKFVLDDVSLSTVFQVLLPFGIFFLLSLFMVYLAKPVIKKIPKSELKRKGKRRGGPEGRSGPVSHAPASQMFYDSEEYLPQTEYRTGPLPPMPEDDRDMKILDPPHKTAPKASPVQERPRPAVNTRAAVSRPAPVVRRQQGGDAPARQTVPPRQEAPAKRVEEPKRIVSSVEVPSVTNEDFFAKYDDPAYVERRLRELKEGRNGKA